jgi:hypothetical protein
MPLVSIRGTVVFFNDFPVYHEVPSDILPFSRFSYW